MTEPFYADRWLTAYEGDARSILADLPADSVHCVVTSPPYWGLREYDLPSLVWGGNSAHEHEWGGPVPQNSHRYTNENSGAKQVAVAAPTERGSDCHCGAWLGQLGLEPDIDQYVAHLLEVLRAVHRVLRSDGTMWLNLGDSYFSDWGSIRPEGAGMKENDRSRRKDGAAKAKQLVGMPWRVALALQAEGWFLRSDVVWYKPNTMPESVQDRPTKSHEYVFLLSKSARYYYDGLPVRQVTPSQAGRKRQNDPIGGASWVSRQQHSEGGVVTEGGTHQLRDVWAISTQAYPGSHFAVFPQPLVLPCIRVGTSPRGVCAECGAPRVRVTKRRPNPAGITGGRHREVARPEGLVDRSGRDYEAERTAGNTTTLGWRSSCDHDAPEVPATVLDPFAGTGTVGIVARRYLRRAIMVDLDGSFLRDRLVTRAEYETEFEGREAMPA